MQNLEQERARFEAWAKSRGNQMQMIGGEYACPITSDQWEAWQARCPDGWDVATLERIRELCNGVTVVQLKSIIDGMLASVDGEES